MWRWSDEKEGLTIHPHLVEEDKRTPPDQRTMLEVGVKMGNSLSNMIQLTGDWPSEQQSGRMPLLNTRVWVEGKVVQYEHYRKPMANPLIMLKISAMPDKIRRNVLSQEVMTIRRHLRPERPWDVTVKHMNNLSEIMVLSGYSET